MFEEPVSIKNSNCTGNKLKMFQSKKYEKKFDFKSPLKHYAILGTKPLSLPPLSIFDRWTRLHALSINAPG